MTWTYKMFSANQCPDVMQQMIPALNGLSRNEGVTAKTGLADQAKKDAFGALFYDSGASQPPVPDMTGSWSNAYWSKSNSDSDWTGILNQVMDTLNGKNTQYPLTPQQAAYAKLSMSNINPGTSYVSLWWQNET